MHIFVSSLSELKKDGAIVDVIMDNLHLIHDNKDSRQHTIHVIRGHLDTLRDDLTIVVETDYVDKVYRDSYYTLYSTKLRDYSRSCVRLSFFEPIFDEYTEITVNNIESLKRAYLGYLIIRPLAESCIGRNLISPKAKRISSMLICKTSAHPTCMGLKMRVEGFPHSSQDGEVMSCAETTLWSILEYFGSKYSDYRPALPSDIIAALKPFSYERQIPSSGLSFEQISIVLKNQGFGSKVYERNNPMFQEIFTCYIESGIPLAVCIETKDFGHAVVCIGRKDINRDIIQTEGDSQIYGKNYCIWNKCVEEFIFNDDNYPSYQPTTFKKPTAYYSDVDWHSGIITHFIVPLHPKVYLDAELAIQASNYLVAKKINVPEHNVIRTFLVSNRTYREYIIKNDDISEEIKQVYLHIDMPKFVWVTEISDKNSFCNNKVNGLILLDATGSKLDNEGYSSLLFYQYDGIGTFFNKEIMWFENYSLSLPKNFESFSENLK